MMYSQTQQAGFSLVETLVAITILLIIIVGPMTISTSAARSTTFASEQVAAFLLAQEGAELVQKVRDDYLLSGGSWSDFVNTTGDLEECYESAGCGLATTNDAGGAVSAPVSCSPIGNCRLYFETNTSAERMRYTHTNSVTASTTAYTRVITLDEIAPGQVLVESTVNWRSGNFRDAQEVKVDTYLFDIYGI